MPRLRNLALSVSAVALLTTAPVDAQKVSFLSGREPHGVEVYEMAMTPSMRKWEQSQSFYHFYRWTGDGYTNYATENYQRYVSTELEGFRTYDMYGNYMTRGFSIYSWSIDSPTNSGYERSQGTQVGSWFRNLVVSSMSKGGFYSALMIGDAINTRLTPLTFNKPAFSGIQWDFASDYFEGTILSSRLASPGTVVLGEKYKRSDARRRDKPLWWPCQGSSQRLSQLGFTYLNVANFSAQAESQLAERGVDECSKRGQVETIVLRLSDDSPEDGIGGTRLFSERILIDGVEHPEIVPVLRGGVRRGRY